MRDGQKDLEEDAAAKTATRIRLLSFDDDKGRTNRKAVKGEEAINVYA